MAEKQKVKVTAKNLIDTYKSDQMKMEALQRRQQGLQQILAETTVATQAITEIKKSKKEDNILIGLGAGIYTEAKITGLKLKSSLAGTVLIDKTPDKILKKLKDETEKTQKELAALQNEMKTVIGNMQSIAGILQESRKAAQNQTAENTKTSSVS